MPKSSGALLLAKREEIFAKVTRINDFISKCTRNEFAAASAKHLRVDRLSSEFSAVQAAILEFNDCCDVKDHLSYTKEGESFDNIKVMFLKLC
jgi:hypothetical protein